MPDVELTLSNGKAYVQQGKIDAISGTVDESTGAISLRASFLIPTDCYVTVEAGRFLFLR